MLLHWQTGVWLHQGKKDHTGSYEIPVESTMPPIPPCLLSHYGNPPLVKEILRAVLAIQASGEIPGLRVRVSLNGRQKKLALSKPDSNSLLAHNHGHW